MDYNINEGFTNLTEKNTNRNSTCEMFNLDSLMLLLPLLVRGHPSGIFFVFFIPPFLTFSPFSISKPSRPCCDGCPCYINSTCHNPYSTNLISQYAGSDVEHCKMFKYGLE